MGDTRIPHPGPRGTPNAAPREWPTNPARALLGPWIPPPSHPGASVQGGEARDRDRGGQGPGPCGIRTESAHAMSSLKPPRLPLTTLSQRLPLIELPAEVLELVALWLPTVPDLYRLQRVCHACCDACASRLAQLPALLGRFPRMAHLLRTADEAHCARPLDFDAIHRAQEAAEAAVLSEDGVPSEEGRLVCPFPPHEALSVTVDVMFQGEVQASWTGPHTHAFPSLREAAGPRVRCTLEATVGCEAARAGGSGVRLIASVGPYPRVWATRPAFINRLNRMNEEAPDEAAAAWARLGLRIYVSRGVRSQKVYEGGSDGGDGLSGGWSDMEARVIGELHTAEDGLTVVTLCPRLCDDGELELDLLGFDIDGENGDIQLSAPRVHRYLNLASAPLS